MIDRESLSVFTTASTDPSAESARLPDWRGALEGTDIPMEGVQPPAAPTGNRAARDSKQAN
jgi:hypothetical protein